MPKITRLKITNFRGIEALDLQVPAKGAVVKGSNGRGKTSVLKGIVAALAANGIEKDAIRHGAESAEVLVDLDNASVRRLITSKGTSLKVTNAEGDAWAKPQTRLDALFGGSVLDPLAFYLADAKERRRQILAASPVTVTPMDVERWTGVQVRTSYERHGLEVLADVRKMFADERAEANRKAKELDGKVSALAESLAATPKPEGEIPSVAFARDKAAKASRALAELNAQAEAAKKTAAAVESQRDQLAQTMGKIAALTEDESKTADNAANLAGARSHVAGLEARIAELQAQLNDQRFLVKKFEGIQLQRAQVSQAIEALTSRQADLEQSIAAMASIAVDEDALAQARANAQAAEALVDAAEQAAKWTEAEAAVDEAKKNAAAVRETAEEIDAIVKRLSTDVPLELAGRSQTIPGLEVTEDGVTLDGKSLDGLCGKEQLAFAVTLAKRLSPKAKLLVCDGLERLDSKAMDEFVNLATADDWQLLATRVSDGELVVEAIEAK